MATDKQKAVLKKFGFKNADEMTMHEASQALDACSRRRSANLCTYKQAKILKKYDYPTNATFDEAGKIIDAIAANGWRRPKATALA